MKIPFMIAIHGSLLTSSDPRDIDVVVTPGTLAAFRPEIEAQVRAWVSDKARELPGRDRAAALAELPLDIQELDGIPQLPFCDPAPVEVLQFKDIEQIPIKRIVQWDLSAWVRACEGSPQARAQFMVAYANLIGSHPNSRAHDVPKVRFCDMDSDQEFGLAYSGGGRKAMDKAIDKCPSGAQFIMEILLASTPALYMFVDPRGKDSPMRAYISAAVRHGSGGGAGVCYLTAAGVWTDHGGLRRWDEMSKDLEAIGDIGRRRGMYEREVLASVLAWELSQKMAHMAHVQRIGNELFKLTLFGQADSPAAAQKRDLLRRAGLTPAQWMELEGLPMADLMNHPDPGARKVTLFNCAIMTGPGTYSLKQISASQAKQICDGAEINSAIGHAATAEVLGELLGAPVPVNRQEHRSVPGEVGIVLKMNGRPPEGVILDRAQMEAIGYCLFVVVHLRG